MSAYDIKKCQKMLKILTLYTFRDTMEVQRNMLLYNKNLTHEENCHVQI